QITTATSKNTCKPPNNAPVTPDGNDGIDNSFGKNILPLILGVAQDAPTQLNAGIEKGSFTIMLAMDKLGKGTDYNPILTKLYGGATLTMAGDGGMVPATPKWDGSDLWPVIPELLNNPADISSAKVQFKESYLVKNVWVSGSKGTINLNLQVQGYSLSLT